MDLVNLRCMGDDHGLGVPRPEQLGALEDLRHEGKLDLIGVSNVSAAGLEAALELVEVGQVQNPYSVLDRASEDVLDLCRERGIAFVPFFPLGSAFTGGPRKLAADPVVAAVAEAHGATPPQVALAWLLHVYEGMLLIPGTSSVTHLEENLAAGQVALTTDEVQRLTEGVATAA
jgi:pyridoxine 4-dehydrogenase